MSLLNKSEYLFIFNTELCRDKYAEMSSLHTLPAKHRNLIELKGHLVSKFDTHLNIFFFYK